MQFAPRSEKLRAISMRPFRSCFLLVPFLAFALAGCASSEVRQGGGRPALGGVGRVFLAPIHNATPDETAGRAVTELAATTLLVHGVPLAQTEDGINRSRLAGRGSPGRGR